LAGVTLEPYKSPDYVPDFKVRLEVLLSVVQSVVDLNKMGYMYIDWKPSQWRQVGGNGSRMVLVDIEEAREYMKSVVFMPFTKGKYNPSQGKCAKKVEYMCDPRDIVLYSRKYLHRINQTKMAPKVLKFFTMPVDELPTEHCAYRDVFSPTDYFEKTFHITRQYESVYYTYHAFRICSIIKDLLPQSLLPPKVDDRIRKAVYEKCCDVVEPPSTIDILLTLQELRDKY